MKILITGKNGFIAKALINNLKYNITGVGREDFDLTSREETNRWLEGKHFDVVIHTAIVGGSRLKQDDGEVFYQNLSMFFNLLVNKDKFTQLITFGSGAELGDPFDPYGLSKNIINRIIQSETKINSIRIYGVFGADEWDSRFIKANIRRYINKESLNIHQNKIMDFFYIDDLVSLVEKIIQDPSIKEIDSSYEESYSLLDIANIINQLSQHRCTIEVDNQGLGQQYRGEHKPVGLDYIGLKKGIERVYESIN